MKEILFKGKTIKEGKWIEGSLIIDERGNYYIGECIKKAESLVIEGGRMNGKTLNRFIGIGFAMVDKDTVCEYTQLKDKNGKRIWENDIVRTIRPCSTDKYEKGEVLFGEYPTAFQSSNVGYYVDWSLNKNLAIYCKINDIEVIGNSIDNPELLMAERSE